MDIIDMLWPLSDRHWLVQAWNNHEIRQKSNNKIWEHPWALIKNGEALMRPRIIDSAVKNVDLERFEEAIYLPVSNGSWVTIAFGKETLVVYSATAAVWWIDSGGLDDAIFAERLG